METQGLEVLQWRWGTVVEMLSRSLELTNPDDLS